MRTPDKVTTETFKSPHRQLNEMVGLGLHHGVKPTKALAKKNQTGQRKQKKTHPQPDAYVKSYQLIRYLLSRV